MNQQRNRDLAAQVERGSVREGEGPPNYDEARTRV